MERKIQKTIPLLTIGICLLSCGCEEGQELKEQTVNTIKDLESVGGTLYLAADEDGVFKLNNKSQSWEWIDLLYAQSLAGKDATLYVGEWAGIYRLEADGSSFTRITKEYDEWVNRPVRALAVEGDTIYAIRNRTLVRSTNRGLRWHEIRTRPWHDFQRLMSLAVQGDTIYILTERQGVFRSVDRGDSWTPIKGLPDQPSGLLFNLPLLLDKNTLYIGTFTGIYRLPTGASTVTPAGLDNQYIISLDASRNALYTATAENGIFRSDDGGETWHSIGLKGTTGRTLAVFENRLYVGTNHEGIFYTADEGHTWHPLNKELNLRPY